MHDTRQLLIAGEPFEVLLRTLRRMYVTRVVRSRAHITFNPTDPAFAAWARAAERYAADLITPGCELTRDERFELGAQQVVGEVEAALRASRREP